MIEVLVSLVLLSFGSLGAAGLQTTSKQAHHEAQQRLVATFLANDMVERMRNNPAVLATYATSVGNGSISDEPSPNCTAAAPCTPDQLATHDLWVWEQAMDGVAIRNGNSNAGGIAGAAGCVANTNGQVQVVVAWHAIDNLSDAGAGNIGVSTCGVSDAHRRQVVVNTFIN